jgi:hypothetical protein
MPFVLVGLILVLAIVALLCADFLRSEALAVAPLPLSSWSSRGFGGPSVALPHGA